jgi:hypothetical protein
MKSSKIPPTQISNVKLSEAARNAFDVLVNVLLGEAQKMADKKAKAEHRIERTASKSRIEEMTAANAVQAKTILDMGRQLADHAVKTEAAREEIAVVGRQLAEVTERAARAERLAENMAVQIANWKGRWQTMRTHFAEGDAEPQERAVQCERLDMSPLEDERGHQPVVTAEGVCTASHDRCQREEASCIEAAIVLLGAAARYSRHMHSLCGGKSGPLNDLRGSNLNDAVEPGLS